MNPRMSFRDNEKVCWGWGGMLGGNESNHQNERKKKKNGHGPFTGRRCFGDDWLRRLVGGHGATQSEIERGRKRQARKIYQEASKARRQRSKYAKAWLCEREKEKTGQRQDRHAGSESEGVKCAQKPTPV